MRRDPLEILEEIFKVLEEGRALSINQISQRTGIHNITVRRYVQVIETIRKEPQIEVIKTSHSIIIRVNKPKEPEKQPF